MSDPRVSILLAVHNGAAYLRRAVESLLGQTFSDFELILMDDGSTDESWDLIRACAKADPRICPIRNEENIGLTRSLNRAIPLARGEYIARQDADDVSAAERLEAQLTLLEHRPEVGMVGTAYHVVDADGRRLCTQRLPVSDTHLRWAMLFYNPFCHSSVMFRRPLLSDGVRGYDPELPCAQDYDLWERLLRRTRVANLDAPLVELRVHPKSISATRAERQRRIAAAVARRQMTRLLPEHGLTAEDVHAVRRLHERGCDGLCEDDLSACRMFVHILSAFGRQRGIDGEVFARIREHWLGRIMASLPPRLRAAAVGVAQG